ncbi:MAG: hypothetical protein ABI564_07630 [Ideonella sp.]
MLPNELDACYTQLCTSMTTIGEDRSKLFLARFALLAIEQIGDAAAVARLIEAAADDISDV